MRRFFVFAVIALGSFALYSCSEKQDLAPEKNGPTPLVLGFENWSPANASETDATKTYMYQGNSASPSIHWFNTGMDKVLFVFQASNGAKRKYVSDATDDAPTRAFVPDTNVPDLVANKDIAYVLWSGKAGQDNSKLENGLITSNGSLCLNNPQTLNKSQSFESTSNIAIAKATDTCLKNVFGYIKFVNAAGPTNKATIKSIEFQADEYLSGQIQIDYSGSEPVASIIDNDKASKSLVVNARKLGSGVYEAGTWYACLVPGVYHNFKMIVTPFSTEGDSAEAATDASFTLNGGTVTIVRSKWSNAGTIPQSNPNAFVWPDEATSFDYGLSFGDTKTAKVTADSLTVHGVSTTIASGETVTIDKVTYCGDVTYTNKCGGYFTVQGSGAATGLPTRRYVSFNINKPGSVSFFPRYPSDQPTLGFRVILKTKKNGVTTTKDLYNGSPENRSTSDPNNIAGGYEDYLIKATVTKSDLIGIDEPATIYICHHTVYTGIHYIYLTWAPADI